MTIVQALRDLKSVVREPYAWPGGYPRYLVMNDGEALSADAARANFRQICRSTITQASDGWQVVGAVINWEDPALYCAHSGARIESAYAEDSNDREAV